VYFFYSYLYAVWLNEQFLSSFRITYLEKRGQSIEFRGSVFRLLNPIASDIS